VIDLLSLLIGLIVVGVIVYLLMYAVDYVGLPQPFNKVAKVIIILIAIVYLINLLSPFIGGDVSPLNLK